MKSFFRIMGGIILIASLLFSGCGFPESVPVEPVSELSTSPSDPAQLPDEPNETTFTIATWNIGHFSKGGKYYPTAFTESNYARKLREFQSYINSLGADILSLNEYSNELMRDEADTAVKKELLSDYPIVLEGDQRYYSCNALYSKVALENVAVKEYECNQGKWKNVQINPNNGTVKATQYYYIEADLNVDGKQVKVVCTHLAFQGIDKDPLIKDQVDELIEKFSSYDRVIMMGDWNSEDFPFFKDCFEKGGFRLANENADTVTYPSDLWVLSLDNFVYKGVTVRNFQVKQTDLSDHYAVVCRMSVD